jgi:hypothetical protein
MLGFRTGSRRTDIEQETDLFELANLFPATTGLPMTIWVSPKGGARHDARVKVCLTPGNQMDASNTAVVAIWPSPKLMHGDLLAQDLAAVTDWIALNAVALLEYWDGRIDTIQLSQRLHKV